MARNRAIAEVLGVSLIENKHRKPNSRALGGIIPQYKKMVVVGDKVLTDGLFALSIGATFIHISPRVTDRAESLADKIFNATDDIAATMCYGLLLMRPRQWVKNILIFAPLFFARQLFDGTLLQSTCAAFFAFCFLASAGYILNAAMDVAADRLDTHKCRRPIASGDISVGSALFWRYYLRVPLYVSSLSMRRR